MQELLPDAGILGEDALMIPYGDSYFFNEKQKKEGRGQLWMVWKLMESADGFSICFTIDDDGDTLLTLVEALTPVEAVLDEENNPEYFVINPDPDAFTMLVGKGGFNACFNYRRIR